MTPLGPLYTVAPCRTSLSFSDRPIPSNSRIPSTASPKSQPKISPHDNVVIYIYIYILFYFKKKIPKLYPNEQILAGRIDRAAAGDDLEEEDAEGEDVGLLVDDSMHEVLRGKVTERPLDRNHGVMAPFTRQPFRQPEIGDLQISKLKLEGKKQSALIRKKIGGKIDRPAPRNPGREEHWKP